MAQTSQDIEKWVSVPLKGVKKVFPVKNGILNNNFSFLEFATFVTFSKNHEFSFCLVSGLCHINGKQHDVFI